MNRRHFLQLGADALALGALHGCAQPSMSRATPPPVTAAAWRARRRFLRTPQGRIAWVEQGRGPAALFLHGFPLNSYQWRDILPRLAPHRRCLAPDFLGLGHTEPAPGQSVAPEAQVTMLIAFLDALSIPHVDLVANDSGGAVAQLFLVRHPARVRTLLLTNCDTEPDSPPPALLPVIALAREGLFADRWLAPWLADKTLARSPEGLGGMCYADPTQPTDDAIDTYLGPLVSSAPRKALTHAYALALDPNPLAGLEPALRRSTAPTRIVWGTGDTIFSSASPDYLDHVLGNSRGVRRVPGAKLFFPEEQPDLIAEEARALWGVDQRRQKT